MVSLILNILWFVLGGWAAGLGWLLSALLMALTIIGLPWTFACLRMAGFAAWPFGRVVMRLDDLTGNPNAIGGLHGIGNVVWFVLAGWWLALGHVVLAAGLALTIIGIPFAFQHVKLAQFSVWPLGRRIIDVEEARMMRGY